MTNSGLMRLKEAKNNKFLAGEGDDIIIYRNDYDTDDIAEPTVTINVGADETDTVVMNKGRVGSTVATDTLENVETMFPVNTAQVYVKMMQLM